jgi:hypothetical protein
MNTSTWTTPFHALYDKAVTRYQRGNRQPKTFFSPREAAFLAGIGCSVQELYDFAEDWCQDKMPTFDDVLLITAARRDYFLVVQKHVPASRIIDMAKLPAKDASVAGLVWLPRIIGKARAKLRGELPAELMYGCGGDRAFLKKTNIHPADFLRHVWAAGDDDQKIIDYVKRQLAA